MNQSSGLAQSGIFIVDNISGLAAKLEGRTSNNCLNGFAEIMHTMDAYAMKMSQSLQRKYSEF